VRSTCFSYMCKNVLPAYSSAKIIKKNQTSFSSVMITNVLPRFFSQSQCISETVHDRDGAMQTTYRKSYVTHRTAAIPMTFSDLQGSFTYCKLLKYDFSYSCAPVDKISTVLRRRAVPLRRMTFLFQIRDDS